MSEERPPSKLQRLLSARLWGKAKPVEPRPKFEELTHAEQQMALLWGERDYLGVLATLGIFVAGQLAFAGSAAGLLIAGMLFFPAGPIPAEEQAELLSQLRFFFLHMGLTLAAFAAVILAGPRLVTWALARWPRQLASISTERTQSLRVFSRRFNIGLAVIFIAFVVFLGWRIVLLALIVGTVLTAHCMLLLRRGVEPSCRRCGYSLPLEQALPSHCPECGIELREPWGRALGQPRSRLLWWGVFAFGIAGSFVLGGMGTYMLFG